MEQGNKNLRDKTKDNRRKSVEEEVSFESWCMQACCGSVTRRWRGFTLCHVMADVTFWVRLIKSKSIQVRGCGLQNTV